MKMSEMGSPMRTPAMRPLHRLAGAVATHAPLASVSDSHRGNSPLVLSLVAMLASCGPFSQSFVATDGSHYGMRYNNASDGNAAANAAAIASAAHDLPCERAAIIVVMNTIDDFVLEGCGQRVAYKSYYSNREVHLALTGRLSK